MSAFGEWVLRGVRGVERRRRRGRVDWVMVDGN